uniref:15-cis-phytoene synthase n=1 Tax=Chrysotila carterae TaxID=13221 RepID=A0A7S4C0J6_CHRCT|mmetsp:Transcript_22367/g.47159  ORF Transcript_22367/g.47159 Transcript_22367/m.47159 type:complete len:304 (+) Transcript_22367:419-1330(+)
MNMVFRPHARLFGQHARSFSASAKASNYCVDLVKHQDRERYLCNLLVPQRARGGLFALHALNIELAQLKGVSKEQSIPRMRVAWWRQTLAQAIAGSPPEHPVAQAIADAYARYGLTARLIEQLLDAREDNLEVMQPADRKEVMSYCERTAGALLLLGLECVQVTDSLAAEQAAVHVGSALGLATILRGTHAHASQSSTFIPEDVAQRHGLTLKKILSGRDSPELRDAVAELASEATTHLLAARALRAEVPASARSILLPAGIADVVLQRLQQNAYNVFTPKITASAGVRLPAALAMRNLFGRF